MSHLTRYLKPLASAALFYYTSLWLVMLVIVGTISQKFFGLQASLAKYFSAWIIKIDMGQFFSAWTDGPLHLPFYLPSGRLVMAIIMLNLIAKLLLATKWKKKMIGINITHLGVLVLMAGGVITAYTSTEGYLSLPEGSESSIFKDFHALELAVTDHSPADHDSVTAFSDGFFTPGNSFTDPAVPFHFEIIHYFPNCKVIKRKVSRESTTKKYKGNAQRFELKELPPDKNDRNAGGLEVLITGADPTDNGIYLFFFSVLQGSSTATINDGKGKSYELELRPRHYQLPFTVHLNDFEKLNHAGTMMARAFRSKVTVSQDGHSENLAIYMNHPLRRNGYTLYQSGFDGSPNHPISTFQVTFNKAQLIPYIAIIIITIGLILHAFIQVPRLLQIKN